MEMLALRLKSTGTQPHGLKRKRICTQDLHLGCRGVKKLLYTEDTSIPVRLLKRKTLRKKPLKKPRKRPDDRRFLVDWAKLSAVWANFENELYLADLGVIFERVDSYLTVLKMDTNKQLLAKPDRQNDVGKLHKDDVCDSDIFFNATCTDSEEVATSLLCVQETKVCGSDLRSRGVRDHPVLQHESSIIDNDYVVTNNYSSSGSRGYRPSTIKTMDNPTSTASSDASVLREGHSTSVNDLPPLSMDTSSANVDCLSSSAMGDSFSSAYSDLVLHIEEDYVSPKTDEPSLSTACDDSLLSIMDGDSLLRRRHSALSTLTEDSFMTCSDTHSNDDPQVLPTSNKCGNISSLGSSRDDESYLSFSARNDDFTMYGMSSNGSMSLLCSSNNSGFSSVSSSTHGEHCLVSLAINGELSSRGAASRCFMRSDTYVDLASARSALHGDLPVTHSAPGSHLSLSCSKSCGEFAFRRSATIDDGLAMTRSATSSDLLSDYVPMGGDSSCSMTRSATTGDLSSPCSAASSQQTKSAFPFPRKLESKASRVRVKSVILQKLKSFSASSEIGPPQDDEVAIVEEGKDNETVLGEQENYFVMKDFETDTCESIEGESERDTVANDFEAFSSSKTATKNLQTEGSLVTVMKDIQSNRSTSETSVVYPSNTMPSDLQTDILSSYTETDVFPGDTNNQERGDLGLYVDEDLMEELDSSSSSGRNSACSLDEDEGSDEVDVESIGQYQVRVIKQSDLIEDIAQCQMSVVEDSNFSENVGQYQVSATEESVHSEDADQCQVYLVEGNVDKLTLDDEDSWHSGLQYQASLMEDSDPTEDGLYQVSVMEDSDPTEDGLYQVSVIKGSDISINELAPDGEDSWYSGLTSSESSEVSYDSECELGPWQSCDPQLHECSEIDPLELQDTEILRDSKISHEPSHCGTGAWAASPLYHDNRASQSRDLVSEETEVCFRNSLSETGKSHFRNSRPSSCSSFESSKLDTDESKLCLKTNGLETEDSELCDRISPPELDTFSAENLEFCVRSSFGAKASVSTYSDLWFSRNASNTVTPELRRSASETRNLEWLDSDVYRGNVRRKSETRVLEQQDLETGFRRSISESRVSHSDVESCTSRTSQTGDSNSQVDICLKRSLSSVRDSERQDSCSRSSSETRASEQQDSDLCTRSSDLEQENVHSICYSRSVSDTCAWEPQEESEYPELLYNRSVSESAVEYLESQSSEVGFGDENVSEADGWVTEDELELYCDRSMSETDPWELRDDASDSSCPVRYKSSCQAEIRHSPDSVSELSRHAGYRTSCNAEFRHAEDAFRAESKTRGVSMPEGGSLPLRRFPPGRMGKEGEQLLSEIKTLEKELISSTVVLNDDFTATANQASRCRPTSQYGDGRHLGNIGPSDSAQAARFYSTQELAVAGQMEQNHHRNSNLKGLSQPSALASSGLVSSSSCGSFVDMRSPHHPYVRPFARHPSLPSPLSKNDPVFPPASINPRSPHTVPQSLEMKVFPSRMGSQKAPDSPRENLELHPGRRFSTKTQGISLTSARAAFMPSKDNYNTNTNRVNASSDNGRKALDTTDGESTVTTNNSENDPFMIPTPTQTPTTPSSTTDSNATPSITTTTTLPTNTTTATTTNPSSEESVAQSTNNASTVSKENIAQPTASMTHNNVVLRRRERFGCRRWENGPPARGLRRGLRDRAVGRGLRRKSWDVRWSQAAVSAHPSALFRQLRVNQDDLEAEMTLRLQEEEEAQKQLLLQQTTPHHHHHHHQTAANKTQLRSNVVNEIISAEAEYVKHLRDVIEGYLKQARKRPEMFPVEKVTVIFSNIEVIYAFATKLLAELQASVNKEQPHLTQFGHCFLDKAHEFEIYSEYCNNHPAACEELREMYRVKRYRHFFEACRLLQEMTEIPLEGFLLTPVQKICKYHLQLAELLKYTPHDHPDYPQVQSAVEAMKRIAKLVNERKRKMESIETLAQWQMLVDDWEGPDILDDSSELIYSGELNKINANGWSQERYFFLFDHQLVYCKKDLLKKNSFGYKGRINMDHSEIITIPDGRDTQYNVTVRNALKIHDQERNKWYLMVAKTAQVKQRWLKAFSDERRRVFEDMEHNFNIPFHLKQAIVSSLKQKSTTNKSKGKRKAARSTSLRATSKTNAWVSTNATLPRFLAKSGQGSNPQQTNKIMTFLLGGKKK